MFASGKFNFPTSTGAFAVTGLGFEPQGVIMIYANKATIGSLLTGLTGPGVGISLNARNWSNPSSILSFGLSPNGRSDANVANFRGIETGPISMQTDAATASVVDYKASAISFDADGFTLTVATAAPGVRPVHWFAWGGTISVDDPTTMQTAMVKQQMGFSPTFDAGFEAWTTMVVSTIAVNGFGEGSVDGSSWFSHGTGHYPATSVFDAQLWKSSVVYTQIQLASPLGRQGFLGGFVLDGTGASDWDALNVSDVLNPLGPVLVEGFRRHRPHAEIASRQEFINEGGASGDPNYQAAIWWTAEGWTEFVTIPAGGSVTVQAPSNFNEFEQIMFTTINGGGGSGNSVPQRYGLGMLSTSDQGCCVFGQDGSFYQSNDECVAHCSASGVSAASGTVNGSTFTLTSTQDDLGDIQVVWHAWGVPSRGWLPQMYRWWPNRRARA